MISRRPQGTAEVQLPRTISVSAATTAMQCGWRHYLRYVLREPEPSKGGALITGIVIDRLAKLVVASVQVGDLIVALGTLSLRRFGP